MTTDNTPIFRIVSAGMVANVHVEPSATKWQPSTHRLLLLLWVGPCGCSSGRNGYPVIESTDAGPATYNVNLWTGMGATGGTLVLAGVFVANGSPIQSSTDFLIYAGTTAYISFGVGSSNRFSFALDKTAWGLIVVAASPATGLTTLRFLQNGVWLNNSKTYSAAAFAEPTSVLRWATGANAAGGRPAAGDRRWTATHDRRRLDRNPR